MSKHGSAVLTGVGADSARRPSRISRADNKVDRASEGSNIGVSRGEAVGSRWRTCMWTTDRRASGATAEEGRAEGTANSTDVDCVDDTPKDKSNSRLVVHQAGAPRGCPEKPEGRAVGSLLNRSPGSF